MEEEIPCDFPGARNASAHVGINHILQGCLHGAYSSASQTAVVLYAA